MIGPHKNAARNGGRPAGDLLSVCVLWCLLCTVFCVFCLNKNQYLLTCGSARTSVNDFPVCHPLKIKAKKIKKQGWLEREKWPLCPLTCNYAHLQMGRKKWVLMGGVDFYIQQRNGQARTFFWNWWEKYAWHWHLSSLVGCTCFCLATCAK